MSVSTISTLVLSSLLLVLFAEASPSPAAAAGAKTTVTWTNCTAALSNKSRSYSWTSGECIPYHHNQSSVRTACGGVGQCTTMILHNGTSCDRFQDVLTFSCNTCTRLGEWATNHFGTPYAKVTCDANSQSTTFTTGCDEGCRNCNETAKHVHPFDTCSPAAVPGMSISNNGIAQCETVHIETFNGSTCSGTPMWDRTEAQHVCSVVGGQYSCSNNSPLNPVGDAKEILISTCLHGCSVNCTHETVGNGQCQPATSAASRFAAKRYTCNKTPQTCAAMAIFKGSKCEQYMFSYSPTCNVCAKYDWGAFGKSGYSMVKCDADGAMVSWSIGCDATCGSCNQTDVSPRPHHECVADSFGHGLSVVNFGAFECNTVQEEHFEVSDCGDASKIASFSEATGSWCQGHRRFQCGDDFSTVPESPETPSAPATVYAAACNASAQPPFSEFQEGDCQPPYWGNHSSSMKVECVADKPAMCIEYGLFNDSACMVPNDPKLHFAFTAVCDSCMYDDATKAYYSFKCNHDTQSVILNTGCNKDCSTCALNLNYAMEQCASNPLIPNSFAAVSGVKYCDAVKVTGYFGTTKCASSASSATWTMPQHTCQGFFGSMLQCSNAPVLPPNPKGEFLSITRCPINHGCVSTQCHTKTARADECYPSEFGGGEITSCLGATAKCASFSFYNGSGCGDGSGSKYVSSFTGVCGACSKWGMPPTHHHHHGHHTNFTPPHGYVRLNCDPFTQEVSFDTDCDPTCTVCGTKNFDVRPYQQCAPGMFPSFSVVNHGLFQCNAVKRMLFTAPNCDPKTMFANFTLASDNCEMGERISCAVKTPVDKIKVERCYCPEGQNCAGETLNEIKSGECMTGSAYFQAVGGRLRHNVSGAVRLTCLSQEHRCASLNMFRDSSCGEYSTSVSAVCNTCSKDRPGGPFGGQFYKVNCNHWTQTVDIDSDCNSDCSVCLKPGAAIHNFDQCSAGVTPGFSVFNSGVEPCYAFVEEFFEESSSGMCLGEPNAIWTSAQYDCEFGSRFVCNNNQPFHTVPISPNTKVVSSVCTNQWCNGPSSECSWDTVTNGVLTPGLFGGYERATCLSQPRNCTRIFEYSGSTCSNGSISMFSSVCNSCMKAWGQNETFVKVVCPDNSQDVHVFSCDDNCANCDATPHVRKYMECATSLDPFRKISLMNVGRFPCEAVQFERFTDASATKMLESVVIPAGQCASGATFFCNSMPPSPEATVTQRACEAGPSANYSRYNYASGSCQTFENWHVAPNHRHFHNTSALPPIRAYKTTCSPALKLCASVIFHNGSSCDKYIGHESLVCDTCWNTMEFGRISIQCDLSTQQIVLRTNCASEDCSHDTASCSGPTFAHPLDKCTAGPHSFLYNAQYYVYNQGVSECESVEVAYYNESTCSYPPIISQQIAQYECSPSHQEFSCSPSPAPLAPPRFAQVLVQDCGNDRFCSSNCTNQVVHSGACNARAAGSNSSKRYTCQSSARCAKMIVFEGTQCNFSSVAGIFTEACDKCTRQRDGTYGRLRCFPDTNTAVYDAGCDQGCNTCKQVGVTPRPVSQCVPGYGGGMVVNDGFKPCDLVEVDLYDSTACGANTLQASYVIGAGDCAWGHKAVCGWFGDVNNPSIPPINTLAPSASDTPSPKPDDEYVFTATFTKEMPYDDYTFQNGLSSLVGASRNDWKQLSLTTQQSADEQAVNAKTVAASSSSTGNDKKPYQVLTFEFVGTNRASFSDKLKTTIKKDPKSVASSLGADAVVAGNAPKPTNSPPPPPKKNDDDDDKNKHNRILLGGIVAGIALLAVIIVVAYRATRPKQEMTTDELEVGLNEQPSAE